MCGHVGVAGKLEYKDEATIKRLLLYDYFRGPDSTGLASIRNNGEVHIAKIASHPLDLFDSKKFGTVCTGATSSAFIGHNRLATKGGINAVNAHPYQCGHITGAHNGTLTQKSWTALDDIIGEKTAVDSHAIFAAMEIAGVDEVVKLLEEGKDPHTGAWALVWHDAKENTLNFLRNKHRPFWYAYSKEFDRVFWASEWPTIDVSLKLSAAGYELYQTQEGYKFFSTKEDWLYRFDLEKLRAGSTERPKPRVKELKGKEPVVVSYAGNSDPFPRRTDPSMTTNYRGTSTGTGSHSNNVVPIKDNIPDCIHISGTKQNPMGGYMTESEFNDLAKYGCAWCSKDVEYGDPGIAVYEAQSMVLCADCAGNEENTRLYVKDLTKAVS